MSQKCFNLTQRVRGDGKRGSAGKCDTCIQLGYQSTPNNMGQCIVNMSISKYIQIFFDHGKISICCLLALLKFVQVIFRKRCQNISTVVYLVNYHDSLSSNQNGLLNYPIRIICSKYSSTLIKLQNRTNGSFIALCIQLKFTFSKLDIKVSSKKRWVKRINLA